MKKLDPHKDFELIRDIFDWIQKEALQYGDYSGKWKDELSEEIVEYYKQRGKVIKKESVKRNINRMIAYYFQTGSQARSGRRYLEAISEILAKKYKKNLEIAWTSEGGIAQEFLILQDARLYVQDIPVLRTYFDPEKKTWVVLRIY